MTVLRVCFVGASLTAGAGDDGYLGWPGRLAAAERVKGHDISHYNLGVRGETTPMIAARWRAECEVRLPPSAAGALVFLFGSSDAAEDPDGGGRRVAPEETANAARAMLAAACAWKPTLMIGPPPVAEERMPVALAGRRMDFRNERLIKLSRILDGVATEVGAPFLDLCTRLGDSAAWRASLMAGDGLHPTGEGYAVLAAAVGAWSAWRDWLD